MKPVEKNIIQEKATELLIAEYIAREKGGFILPRINGRCKTHDVTIYLPHRYEIKHDKIAPGSKNMFFEVRNCKLMEPSGLVATKAELWYHFVPPDRLYWYNPVVMLQHLQDMAGENNFYYKFKPHSGDDNSDGYTVPITIIEKQTWVGREIAPIGIPAEEEAEKLDDTQPQQSLRYLEAWRA